MRRITTAAVCALLLTVSGCVTSLQPVYTAEDVIFDSALLGEWIAGRESWTITRAGKNAYRAVHADENGRTGTFIAHLFKAGNSVFVDVYPVTSHVRDSEFYQGHLLPVHTFALVMSRDPLQFAPLNGEWLKDHLRNNPNALRHERVGDEIMITAPTKEIQAFLLRNLQTQKAFEPLEAWHRAAPLR